METLNIQLSPLFEWLVKTTIQGSVLIGLILLVKIILRGRLPIRWHYFLWLLLLVRLAAPRLPQSRFSIFNLMPESLQTGRVDILPLLWLLGALVMACIVGARNFSLWRTVKRERPITDREILDLLEDCKMEMRVQTIVGVVVSDRVKSPVLFGFVRPRLLLPQGILEAYGLEELRYIFIHELAHFKQRDIYLGWLMALLQILHWFNPLMWFAFHRMRVDRELACDGLAVSMMETDEPPRYGRTILNLFERFSQVSYVPSIAGILEDSSKLERRIKMIAKFKKTSRKRSVWAVLVLVALAYVTLTDAYSAPPFIFGEPTNLGSTVNSSAWDYCPSLSADGLELFFTSQRPGGHGYADIYVATRATTEDGWSDPVNLGPTVNSSSTEGSPSISADGLSLFFYSYRPGGYGRTDIWVSTREAVGGAWSTPANLGPPVNSSGDEMFLSISADGLQLYFSEYLYPHRPGGYGDSDIWVTTREAVGGAWSTPANLGPPVNSSSWEGSPCISADGLSLFFNSTRAGGYGGGDLYVATRATTEDDWGTPVNLGPTVNSSYPDVGPNISADGLSLYFHSDRPGGVGGFDLWQVRVRPMRAITDFNRDGKVDFKDFAEFSPYWFQDEPWVDIAPPPLGDGIIDFKDVGVFAENWLLSTMQASNPNPADGATGIGIDADLSWTPGDGAALHEVYFGSDPYALPLVATQPVGQESYDPPGDLILSTTYYWQIDEVNDAGPPPGNWPGVLWSFTTIRGQAHTPRPADGAVIPGMDGEFPTGNFFIYTSLNVVPGLTADPDPNVRRAYFSKNRDDVVSRIQDANLGPPPYMDPCCYLPDPDSYFVGLPASVYEMDPYAFVPKTGLESLERGEVYYWCVDETDADGHTYPGDIWEFTIQGFYAFAPNPPNDAILVDPNVVLSWGEGLGVQYHDIYLGTSWDDVNNADANDTTGIYRDCRKDPNYPCSNLELTTKFYWRVDEVQGRFPPLSPGIIYKGDVWSFTTGVPPPP